MLHSDKVLTDRQLALESIDEDKQAPIKKLRAALRGIDELKEQLDSVIPFLPQEERVGVTMEMISAWSQAAAPWQLPEAVQMMYA